MQDKNSVMKPNKEHVDSIADDSKSSGKVSMFKILKTWLAIIVTH